MKTYAELQQILQAKANYGFTHAGSAIVEVRWFNQHFSVPYSHMAAVLIYNMEEVYKAYIGNAIGLNNTERIRYVAKHGAKLTVIEAVGMFPGKFEAEKYDRAS
jgi:hypothetical protein